MHQKDMKGIQAVPESSLNESDAFGDSRQLGLGIRDLSCCNLLFSCSYFVYIFIMWFTMLGSNYVHLSLYPAQLKTLVDRDCVLFISVSPTPVQCLAHK